MAKRFLFILLCSLILFTNCKKNKLSTSDYLKWLNKQDNGITFQAQGDLFKYTLKYKPIEEMVLNEVGIRYTRQLFDSISSLYSGTEYYFLKIECIDHSADVLKKGIENETEYYERMNYLTFNMQSDLGQIVKGDTSMCSIYHFERNYGAVPYLSVMLGFPMQDTIKTIDKEILLYSRIEPTPKMIRFLISNENIQKIPQLQL